MSKKSRVGKMLLFFVVIVMANFYSGCVNKYYPPETLQQGVQIREQDAQIKALQKEMEELKKQQ